MKHVSVNGRQYALPFEKLLPPLTSARYAELRADVCAHGVQQQLIVCRTPSWGRTLVEGMHRALIAEELDLDVPLSDLGTISEEIARERCLSLNLKRRHMTALEMQDARQERIARVTQARAADMSLAEIAAQEGVSKTQVARDLQEMEQIVPPGTIPKIRAPRLKVRQPPAVRAFNAARTLGGVYKKLIKSSKRAALEKLAEQHGVPLADGGWPALDAIRAVLRDVAQGGVQT